MANGKLVMENDSGIALRCDETLRYHICDNLAGFSAKYHNQPLTKKAAVAVTIVDSAYDPGIGSLASGSLHCDTAALILTRRSMTLRHHSGQWALPGGRCDPGETALETALRELKEEVGLRLTPDRILGRMDDFTTRSGFTITPVIIWGGSGVELTANPAEVASIHCIPIAEFMREDAPILRSIPESDQPVLSMPVGQTSIAAPTAAILYQFREVAIKGICTRVDHYEQPYFTWG